MTINLRILCFLIVTIAMLGCSSTKIVNISPQKEVPTVTDFHTIDASVKVRCSDPLSWANEDVADSLEKEGVFRKVIAIRPTHILSESDIELYVEAIISENNYIAEKMGKAVVRGMLLRLADQAFNDKYDYEVHLKVILRKGAMTRSYDSIGKYYVEQPVNKKSGKTSEARKLAWEHALKLLTAKIMDDHRNIKVNFLNRSLKVEQ